MSGLIDLHAHVLPPGIAPHDAGGGLWERLGAQLRDPLRLIADSDAAGIGLRVVSTPLSIAGAPGIGGTTAALTLSRRINDSLAGLVAAHPGRIGAFATLDAFGGAAAAAEVAGLAGQGFAGALIDGQSGDRYLGDPAALPVLEALAQARLPVFVHPVSPEPLTGQLEPLGRLGVRVARSTSITASLLSLHAAGRLAELRGLRLLFPALALPGLLLTDGFGIGFAQDGAEVWFDVMGLGPRLIAYAASVAGTGRLVLGSDWPILEPDASIGALERAVAEAGLPRGAAQAIGVENPRRFLGV